MFEGDESRVKAVSENFIDSRARRERMSEARTSHARHHDLSSPLSMPRSLRTEGEGHGLVETHFVSLRPRGRKRRFVQRRSDGGQSLLILRRLVGIHREARLVELRAGRREQRRRTRGAPFREATRPSQTSSYGARYLSPRLYAISRLSRSSGTASGMFPSRTSRAPRFPSSTDTTSGRPNSRFNARFSR